MTGYTDTSGSPGYNQRLSERRANAVAAALERLGVPRSDMVVAGRGKNDLRVPTPPAYASRRTAASRSSSRNAVSSLANSGGRGSPAPAATNPRRLCLPQLFSQFNSSVQFTRRSGGFSCFKSLSQCVLPPCLPRPLLQEGSKIAQALLEGRRVGIRHVGEAPPLRFGSGERRGRSS